MKYLTNPASSIYGDDDVGNPWKVFRFDFRRSSLHAKIRVIRGWIRWCNFISRRYRFFPLRWITILNIFPIPKRKERG